MAGRNLGEAFVSILPDAGLFRAQLLAKLKTALVSVTAMVPVSLDTSRALAELAAMRAAVAQGMSIKVGIDQGSAIAAALQLRQIMSRAGLADFLDVNMPVGKIASQLQLLRRMVNQAGLSDLLGFNIDRSKLAAQIALIGNMSESIPVNFDVGKLAQIALPSGTEVITPVINDAIALQEIAGLLAPRVLDIEVKANFAAFDAEIIDVALPGVETLQRSLADLKAEADFTILDAELVSESTALDIFTRPRIIDITEIINQASGGSSIGASPEISEITAGSANATDALNKLMASKDRLSGNITGTLNPAVKSGSGFLDMLGLSSLGLWGWLNALNVKIPLFGGLLAGVPFLSTVGGFHLVADAILEVLAVLIPAGVALVAFGVAAASTVNDIINKEKALFTITTALGTAFPGLSSGLQHFTDSVQTQVWVLFGEALGVINSHTSLFQQLATGAGQVLDGLGARAALALGGSGLSGLVAKGVQDLQLLGNIIGNVFGILGNVLKVLPGYAQVLFTALQDVTGALEAITGSGAGQALLQLGLALHGAVIWGGLAVTVFLALVKVGLIDWVAGVVVALGEMVSALIAGQGAMILFDLVAAVNPFVLLAIGIGAVVAGAVALVTWLGSMKSASDQLWSSIEKNVNAAQTFAQANTALSQGIQQANTQLAGTPKYIDVVNNSLHGMSSTVTELNPAWTGLTNVQKQAAAQQQLLGSRMDELNKITGSAAITTSDLSSLNIKAGAIATMSAGQYANLVEQIKGLSAATVQLAGYTAGPAAAAQNALTNLWLNEQVPAIQKVTQAEDNLLSVVTGSQSAFNNFQQSIQGTTAKFVSPSGLADAAKLAGGNLDGINQQSLAFSNTLYTQSIPSLQKLIDSLQQQSIGTGDLSKVVATGAGQMLTYTGNNTEARAVIVGLINNALGPGTVSLQTLNTWVKNNSTSLTGMNAIVAESTIKAGTLASVLQNNLTVQFRADLLAVSGASGALKTYTGDIENNTTTTANGVSDRAKLIQDLVNSGLSAKQATSYVNGLSTQIGNLKGKTVDVILHAAGSGSITFNESTGVGSDVTGGLKFLSGGGVMSGFGGGDSIPALLEPGETVVDKMTTKKFARVLKMMGVPGFAAGGYVPNLTGAQNWAGGVEGGFGLNVEKAWSAKALAALKAAVKQIVAQSVLNAAWRSVPRRGQRELRG